MPARGGNSAFEKQPAFFVIQKRLARSFSVEATGFNAFVIRPNRYARNLGGGPPNFALLPTIRLAFRFDHKHISFNLSLTVRHKQRKFSYARPCAGTLRMCEHNQNGLILRRWNRAL